MSARSLLSRRNFLVKATVVGGVLQAWPAVNMLADLSPQTKAVTCTPIVSFHMDQPYVDPTGTAIPYRPAAGARSAAPLCACDEELLRHHLCYAL